MSYKLTYFNAKGVSEPIRYLFGYAGMEFEDVRIEKDDWPAIKAEQPFGQLPVLDTGDAFILTQSVAIARFLGNTFGLMGRDSVHNAQLDALVDHMQDLHMKLYAAIRSCDESTNPNFARGAVTANATFVSNVDDFEMNVLPFYLIKFNAIAAQGAFYGTDITWADVYFAGFMDCTETRLKKPLLEPYPFLSALKSRVEAAPGVQDYLEGRPFTTM